MNKMVTHFDRILTQIGFGMRMEDIMREDERKAGHQVVKPGEVQWLPAADWHSSIVVSIDGLTVRLIAILATNPGNGAFRRLIEAIEEAGLKPCIIAPTTEMRTTLARWGWRGKQHGVGFESEERWRPRRAHLK